MKTNKQTNKNTQYQYRKIAKANPEITGWFDGCVVHHKDFNHENNSIENLQCMDRSDHLKFHHSVNKNFSMGGKKHTIESNNKRRDSNPNTVQVIIDGITYPSIGEAVKLTGLSRYNIKILNNIFDKSKQNIKETNNKG